jgi:hypothetical protein
MEAVKTPVLLKPGQQKEDIWFVERKGKKASFLVTYVYRSACY